MRTKNHKWSDDELKFLITNYSNNGVDFCAESLTMTKPKIRARAHNLGLILDKNKSINLGYKYHLDHLQFINVEKPEIAYILGFLWGDGSIRTGKTSQITISCLTEDINSLKHIFDKSGEWSFICMKRKNKSGTFNKEQTRVQTCNKRLIEYLGSKNYLYKSGSDAQPIIDTIPKHLRYYWFRGLMDADGCWFSSNKYRNKYVSITSTFDQDWSFMESLSLELGIKFNLTRYHHKKTNHRCSRFMITRLSSIKMFRTFIYPDDIFDGIGLNRKYIKSLMKP